jgi:hypothetical protein
MEYKELLLNFLIKFIKVGFYIYIPVQAIVYIFGRMLGIFNGYRTRNTLALLSAIGISYFYIYYNNPNTPIFNIVYEWMQNFSITILYYVLLGFRLASRMDSFLDHKFAEDEEKEKK